MKRPRLLLLAAVFLLSACQSAATPAPTQKPAEQGPAAAKPTEAPAAPAQPASAATLASLPTAPPKLNPPRSGGVLNPPTDVPTPGNNPANVDAASKGWVKLASKVTPPARYDHAFTAAEGYVFRIFGGRSDSVMNDSWLYGLGYTEDWQIVTSTLVPSARFGITAAFDWQSAYIFGGQFGNIFLNDVWIFPEEHVGWRRITTTGETPPPRAGTSLVVGPRRESSSLSKVLIVSHGYSSRGYLDDTYALDLQTNLWRNITPNIRPMKRAGQAATLDTQNDRMYLFGGQTEQGSLLGDLWVLDPVKKSWTELKPNGARPTDRTDATLAYDDEGYLWLFGGRTISGATNELWKYDPNINQWTPIITANAPAARSKHRAIWYSVTKLTIFGGMDANGNALNDLWTYTP